MKLTEEQIEAAAQAFYEYFNSNPFDELTSGKAVARIMLEAVGGITGDGRGEAQRACETLAGCPDSNACREASQCQYGATPPQQEQAAPSCIRCGGTGLYTAFSADGGALPDTDCELCAKQAAPGAVQDGFVMVPKEPTPEMVEAARWEDGEHTARAVYAAMIAAAPKAVVQDGWMPIETAPKDKEVLVWFGPDVGVKSAVYTFPWDDGYYCWCVDDEKFDARPVRRYCAPYPTHWMPLPAAPKAQEPGA